MNNNKERDTWTEREDKRMTGDLKTSGLLMLSFVVIMVIYLLLK